jgi:hypothetical protein
MSGILYKPATSKGPIVLVPSSETNIPTITASDGTVIKGVFVNDVEGNKQYKFPDSITNQSNLTLTIGDKTAKLGSGASAYAGPSLDSLAPRGKGSLSGAPSTDTSGIKGPYKPNQQGFGISPANIEKLFPKAEKMPTTQLKMTNPTAYAKQFQDYVNSTYKQNADFSKSIALDQLNTELEGMQAFIPAAQALKQKTTSADNTFNQDERTSQLNKVLAPQIAALDQQTKDAVTYASGHALDSATDSALTLNARGAAADKASVGGFGASSSVAKKTSDLMDANQRIELSKYGEGLIQSNSAAEAGIKLAPTEYSNAGGQINVVPTNAGATQSGITSNLNSYGLLPVQTGLSTTVQQNQIQANFTDEANKFNTTTANQFALDKFGYQAGYAGAVAGAAQTDVNAQTSIAQQQQYLQTMQAYQAQSQNSGLIGSLASGLGSSGIGGLINQGVSGVTNAISSIFKGGS